MFPTAFNPNIPPRSPSHKPNKTRLAHPVSIVISVLTLEIVTGKMEIVMDFEIVLRWMDRRLTYRNLKEDSVINSLGLDTLKQLWIPEVSPPPCIYFPTRLANCTATD